MSIEIVGYTHALSINVTDSATEKKTLGYLSHYEGGWTLTIDNGAPIHVGSSRIEFPEAMKRAYIKVRAALGNGG